MYTFLVTPLSGMTLMTNDNGAFPYCLKSNKDDNPNVPATLIVSSDEDYPTKSCMTPFRKLWRRLKDGNIDNKMLKLSRVWKIESEDSHEDKKLTKKLPSNASIRLIDLTLKRLAKKKVKRQELTEDIKIILKETKKKSDKLLRNAEVHKKNRCHSCHKSEGIHLEC